MIDDERYIVLEYCELGDLKDLLRRSVTPYETATLLDMCCQLCAGVEYLHEKDVIHRDLACRKCVLRGGYLTCYFSTLADSGFLASLSSREISCC
jgi:serine/threonine protein kinase